MAFPKVDIVKYRAWWFGLSLAVTVPGLIAVIVCCFMFGGPIKPGIDFTGGSLTQYQFAKPVQLQDVRNVVESFHDPAGKAVFEGSQVQEASVGGKQVIVVRTKSLPDDKADEADRKLLDEQLRGKFGEPTVNGQPAPMVMSRDKVSGVVGPELLQSGLLALFITLGAMVVYIGSRFQNYDFAVCAIIALFHDVLVLCGIFAVLSLVLGTEADSLFISAVLTVIGFSVHDTIVVFDRIRENSKFVGSKAIDKDGKEYRRSFGDIANDSVNQTLARSIYTSFTVIMTLTALYVLGGTTTRDFVLAMLIGIISGTYSSIFNASALLVWWREQQLKKKKKAPPATATAASAAKA